jgi:protein involved in polysaccharide export with SLBB domain
MPLSCLARRLRLARGLVASSLALLAIGCASAPPADVAQMAREWSEYMQRDYVLRPGDRLLIHVTPDPDDDLQQEVEVPPQGPVFLRGIERGIDASGSSVLAFREAVRRAYEEANQYGEANDQGPSTTKVPTKVTVTFAEVGAKSVYVTGDVLRSGPVPFMPGMTLTQAIASVGGPRVTADFDDVRLIRGPGSPGQRTQRVNYESILARNEPDYLLIPGDVVYVQTSTVGSVGNFVELYIRRVLPIGGNNPGSFFIF